MDEALALERAGRFHLRRGRTRIAQAYLADARHRWQRYGAGAKLATDLSPNLSRSPVWSAPGQTGCGACHGVPPKDKDHDAGMRLTDCATCHPASRSPSKCRWRG